MKRQAEYFAGVGTKSFEICIALAFSAAKFPGNYPEFPEGSILTAHDESGWIKINSRLAANLQILQLLTSCGGNLP